MSDPGAPSWSLPTTWASTTNYPAGTGSWSATPTKVLPLISYATPRETFPSQYYNYLLNERDVLNAAVKTYLTSLHTYINDIDADVTNVTGSHKIVHRNYTGAASFTGGSFNGTGYAGTNLPAAFSGFTLVAGDIVRVTYATTARFTNDTGGTNIAILRLAVDGTAIPGSQMSITNNGQSLDFGGGVQTITDCMTLSGEFVYASGSGVISVQGKVTVAGAFDIVYLGDNSNNRYSVEVYRAT